jgi:hypothetical protein
MIENRYNYSMFLMLSLSFVAFCCTCRIANAFLDPSKRVMYFVVGTVKVVCSGDSSGIQGQRQCGQKRSQQTKKKYGQRQYPTGSMVRGSVGSGSDSRCYCCAFFVFVVSVVIVVVSLILLSLVSIDRAEVWSEAVSKRKYGQRQCG